MDNELAHQLEIISAGPLCAPFARRVAVQLKSVQRNLDADAQRRLEAQLARILQQQLGAEEGDASPDLADTLFEVVLRLAPDDGTRH